MIVVDARLLRKTHHKHKNVMRIIYVNIVCVYEIRKKDAAALHRKKLRERESNDINRERWQTAHLFRVDKKGEMTTRNGVCRTQLREMEIHTPRR